MQRTLVQPTTVLCLGQHQSRNDIFVAAAQRELTSNASTPRKPYLPEVSDLGRLSKPGRNTKKTSLDVLDQITLFVALELCAHSLQVLAISIAHNSDESPVICKGA
jgi:hypothetical protein